MIFKELRDKYPDVSPEILKQYKEAESHLVLHEDDKDLTTIIIELPKVPLLHHIAGFGLPAEEQIWTPPKMPASLNRLVKNSKTLTDVWETLQNKQGVYKEEIKWIKKQWYHRLNGYWFYNNGTPTYIDGWHYFYCGFWNIDIGLPVYRSRDRKFFLFARYCYTDTKTFQHRNKKGKAIPNSDDDYDMVDTLRRICYGFIYPKHRREGATYKADCILYEMTSRTMNAWSGIQSMNDESAKKAFVKHVVAPWKKLPFFFQPKYEGSTDPKEILSFNPPSTRIGNAGSLANFEQGLNSRINYEVADRNAYDGDKLLFHHGDEEGKTKKENVDERWRVVKQCLSQGSDIHGFTIKTSTVGEMENRGGRNFLNICNESHWDIRNNVGETASGLYILFIPAYDGLEGFIDKYGNSVIDDPTPEQAKDIKKSYGAKQYLESKRKALEDNPKGWAEEVRLFPTAYRECFITSSAETGFNIKKILTRINELEMDTNATIKGNFKWTNGQQDGRVEFVEHPEGKFTVSRILEPSKSNQKIKRDGIFHPTAGEKFTASADPFKFNKTVGRRKSNGGGAVFWNRDPQQDPDDKDIREWDTYRIVCTYNNRVDTKEEYLEDMLMMTVYYGAYMYPEINVPDIWDYFDRRKYSGFLKYDLDERTYKKRATPGFNSTAGPIKQNIFKEWMDYIEYHCERERHKEILEECRDIKGIDDMTNFDLFTAVGGCLIGKANRYEEVVKQQHSQTDIKRYVKVRRY